MAEELDPPPLPNVAVAPETSPTTRVPVNGPLSVPVVSPLKSKEARSTGEAQEDGGGGAELANRVSLAVLPVSVVVLI